MPEEQVTIGELINRIDEAVQVMSPRNTHRRLLLQCRVAIMALADRVPEGETAVTAPPAVPALALASEILT